MTRSTPEASYPPGTPADNSLDVLARAELIARRAHEGQVETLTGEPYINHVQRVVDLVVGAEAHAVAWLHDVLEDTSVTVMDLRRGGIPSSVIESVEILTRYPHETYADYITLLGASGDRTAIYVKLADLHDHLRANCPDSLRERYQEAQWTLINYLRRGSR